MRKHCLPKTFACPAETAQPTSCCCCCKVAVEAFAAASEKDLLLYASVTRQESPHSNTAHSISLQWSYFTCSHVVQGFIGTHKRCTLINVVSCHSRLSSSACSFCLYTQVARYHSKPLCCRCLEITMSNSQVGRV